MKIKNTHESLLAIRINLHDPACGIKITQNSACAIFKSQEQKTQNTACANENIHDSACINLHSSAAVKVKIKYYEHCIKNFASVIINHV